MSCYIGYVYDNKKEQIVEVINAVGHYPCDIRGKLHKACENQRKLHNLKTNDLRFQYEIVECNYFNCEEDYL